MEREQIKKVMSNYWDMNHSEVEDFVDELMELEQQPESEYMAIRKIIRGFVGWQLQEDMIDCLTIDYEVVESYLEQTGNQPQPISEPLKESTIELSEPKINDLLDADVLLIGGIKWYRGKIVTEALVEYAKKKIIEQPISEERIKGIRLIANAINETASVFLDLIDGSEIEFIKANGESINYWKTLTELGLNKD